MSVQLSLIIEQEVFEYTTVLGYNRLALKTRNEHLFKVLEQHSIHLDKPIENYEDEGIKSRITDCYGKPLKFYHARALAELLNVLPLDPWDRAICVFLSALPPTTRIVLYWN